MSFKVPNHTQTPNELFDTHMKDMSEAELKVTLTICRKTFGWHKQTDKISLTQLEKITGMTRTSVSKGVQEGIERGTIERFKAGNSFEYGLVIDEDSTESVPLDSTETIHTKESNNKKKTTIAYYAVIELLDKFAEKFERSFVPQEKAYWIKTARQWIEMGVRPNDVAQMYIHTTLQGLTVKSPASITFAYDALRNKVDTDYEKMHKAVHG